MEEYLVDRGTYIQVGLLDEWAVGALQRAVVHGRRVGAEVLHVLLGVVLPQEVGLHAAPLEGGLEGRGAQRAEHVAGVVGGRREEEELVACEDEISMAFQ